MTYMYMLPRVTTSAVQCITVLSSALVLVVSDLEFCLVFAFNLDDEFYEPSIILLPPHSYEYKLFRTHGPRSLPALVLGCMRSS